MEVAEERLPAENPPINIQIQQNLGFLGPASNITTNNSPQIILPATQRIEKEFLKIYAPISSFTGREKELNELQKLLEVEGKYVVIHGMGGVGKTDLSRKYLQNRLKHYENVACIDAKSEEEVIKAFYELAKKLLNYERSNNENDETIVNDVYTHIYRRNIKGLFVFDNAINSDFLYKYFPRRHNQDIKINVLITSQNNSCWDDDVVPYKLDVLCDEDAISFLTKKLPNIKDDELKLNLAKTLQNLPLALQHAVAFIKMKSSRGKFTVNDYIKNYEQLIIADFPKTFTYDYNKNVHTSVQLNLNLIKNEEKESDGAFVLLNYIAFLAPNDIPTVILEEFMSEDELLNAIGIVEQYSLVTKVDGVLNVHRLVQTVLRIQLQNEHWLLRWIRIIFRQYSNSEQILIKLFKYCFTDKYNQFLIDKSIFIHRDSQVQSVLYNTQVISVTLADYFFKILPEKKQIDFLCCLCSNGYSEALNIIKPNLTKDLVRSKNAWDHLPLCLAASSGDTSVIQILIDCGAEVNEAGRQNNTPLHWAVNSIQLKAVQKLISLGATVDEVDIFGRTALHIAARMGSVDIINVLIENKADKLARDKEGLLGLHYAARGGNNKVTQLFLKYHDVNEIDNFGCTALHTAAAKGHNNIIDLLKDVPGFNLFHADGHGSTAIHAAVRTEQINTIRKLSRYGIDVNSRDCNGRSALHIAAREDHCSTINVLVECGVEIDAIDNSGRTAFHLASREGFLHIINKLLEYNAKVDVLDKNNRTALHLAVINKKDNVIPKLTKLNIPINHQDINENTALHLAVKNNLISTVQELINCGANINLRNAQGHTPLHVAALFGLNDLITILCNQSDGNINEVDNDECTALHLAVMNGHVKSCEILLKNKIDGTSCTKDGQTAMHVAALNGYVEAIQMLFDYGLTTNLRDANGSTPFQLAVQNTQHEAVTKLRNLMSVEEESKQKNVCASETELSQDT